MSGDLARALSAIDSANAEDPSAARLAGYSVPDALLYGQRMSERLAVFKPDADAVQQIAARGQHIRRWEVPRDAYPKTREGYLAWRSALYRFHGEQLAVIMAESGFDENAIARVRKIALKSGIKSDPDVQLIEDVACLVFLEHYSEPFASAHSEDKMLTILRKTWRKMSMPGQQAALSLRLAQPVAELVGRALDPEQ